METPHLTTSIICNALRDWQYPGHHDISQVMAVLAASVKANLALSDKCKASVIDQLDELADEVDNDLRQQEIEQLWRELETLKGIPA